MTTSAAQPTAPAREPLGVTLGRVLRLLLAAAAAAALVNSLSPRGIPWRAPPAAPAPARATVHAARRLLAGENTLPLDARSVEEWERARLPGAVSLPLRAARRETDWLGMLPRDLTLLVYCSDADCDDALLLARLLRAHGFENVVWFEGGLRAWQKAGLPVEGAGKP